MLHAYILCGIMRDPRRDAEKCSNLTEARYG